MNTTRPERTIDALAGSRKRNAIARPTGSPYGCDGLRNREQCDGAATGATSGANRPCHFLPVRHGRKGLHVSAVFNALWTGALVRTRLTIGAAGEHGLLVMIDRLVGAPPAAWRTPRLRSPRASAGRQTSLSRSAAVTASITAGVDRVAGHEPVVVVPAGAPPPGASPTSVAPWVMLPASKGHARSANATARCRHRHVLRRRRRQGRDRHGP